jgi:bacteriorhodopsin
MAHFNSTGIIYVFVSGAGCKKLKILIMAEIHVQAKKKVTPSWIWIVVAVVILAVIAFFLFRNKKADQSNTVNKSGTTSLIRVPHSSQLSYV